MFGLCGWLAWNGSLFCGKFDLLWFQLWLLSLCVCSIVSCIFGIAHFIDFISLCYEHRWRLF